MTVQRQRYGDNYLFNYFRNNPLQAFGLGVMIISIVFALIGPYIVPHSPITGYAGDQLKSPSANYWFGTDANGMDIFSRVIVAYRTDLIIALCGALLAMTLGAPTGIFVGFFDGRRGVFGSISTAILRVMDVIQAFPIFVLALLLVAAFGPNPLNLILTIAITNLPGNLRLARSEVLSLREKLFVEAARAAGNSELKIAFSHVGPNSLTQVIALQSTVMGFGILLTAGLSFVGAGVRVPTPEWGSMIAIGAPSIVTGQWWPSFFPGIFMAATIFGFSMVGEAVTALLDPLERVRAGYRTAD